AFTNSGFFSASLNSQGGFTAKIILAGKTTSFSGQFSNDGFYSNCIPRSGLSPLCVSMHLDLTSTNMYSVTGQVSAIDGSVMAPPQANRAAYGNPTTAFQYTLAIPGGPDSIAQPAGDGFGSFAIDGFGNIKATGTLADNTKFSQSVPISV